MMCGKRLETQNTLRHRQWCARLCCSTGSEHSLSPVWKSHIGIPTCGFGNKQFSFPSQPPYTDLPKPPPPAPRAPAPGMGPNKPQGRHSGATSGLRAGVARGAGRLPRSRLRGGPRESPCRAPPPARGSALHWLPAATTRGPVSPEVGGGTRPRRAGIAGAGLAGVGRWVPLLLCLLQSTLGKRGGRGAGGGRGAPTPGGGAPGRREVAAACAQPQSRCDRPRPPTPLCLLNWDLG